MIKTIVFDSKVVDSLLSYARLMYPREGVLLLRGKVGKEKIVVSDVEIPPFATRGNSFASFPLHMLPMDFSIMGVAHSHPSGALKPSTTDLNKFYGRIMVIIAYPYQTQRDMAVFDREGEPLKYEVAET
jgi:proteasome lid subunit RPN8/RPN11